MKAGKNCMINVRRYIKENHYNGDKLKPMFDNRGFQKFLLMQYKMKHLPPKLMRALTGVAHLAGHHPTK